MIIKIIIRTLTTVGSITVILLVIGLFLDFSKFDQTSGGYEYPYSGWTGAPINFADSYTTPEGMYRPGYVVDLYIDCSTGQLTFNVLKMTRVDFRALSDRAKVIHKPQLVCKERGFNTSSWDSIDDPQGLFNKL